MAVPRLVVVVVVVVVDPAFVPCRVSSVSHEPRLGAEEVVGCIEGGRQRTRRSAYGISLSLRATKGGGGGGRNGGWWDERREAGGEGTVSPPGRNAEPRTGTPEMETGQYGSIQKVVQRHVLLPDATLAVLGGRCANPPPRKYLLSLASLSAKEGMNTTKRQGGGALVC
ncbi:hypothetical protein VTK73DRAFT_4961 [Phialemonium thermophilum]|uniref:Secreted protein n=1 Tax=Phialemonium thermophilum TaxID=223376 RepID=A0ABR3V4G1_9PEZI